MKIDCNKKDGIFYLSLEIPIEEMKLGKICCGHEAISIPASLISFSNYINKDSPFFIYGNPNGEDGDYEVMALFVKSLWEKMNEKR